MQVTITLRKNELQDAINAVDHMAASLPGKMKNDAVISLTGMLIIMERLKSAQAVAAARVANQPAAPPEPQAGGAS